MDALMADKGKLFRYRCPGIIECKAAVCTVQIAPGKDVARQTEVLCACGSPLRYRVCKVEWSVVFYRDGAVFENSGSHDHSSYTHLLPTSKKKALDPQAFIVEDGTGQSEPKESIKYGEEQDFDPGSHDEVDGALLHSVDSIDADQGALKGALARLIGHRRRRSGTESAAEEPPPEYAHLPIYDASEHPEAAVRSSVGTETAYIDRGRDPDSRHPAPIASAKRKRENSPGIANFIRQRRNKQRGGASATKIPPPKRIRRDTSKSSALPLSGNKPSRWRPKISKLLKRAWDSASYSSGKESDNDSVARNTGLPQRRKNSTAIMDDESDEPESTRGLRSSRTWNPWPDGTWEATYPRTVFEQCQFAVHWACEVQGGKRNSVGSSRAENKDQGAHTLRLCRGVMKCTNPNCGIITRPQTKNARRLAQLQGGCSCGALLQHHSCDVKIEYWVYWDGAHFRHSGYHHHERVPVRHMTPRERVEFENIIKEHPRMGPAQLLAGRPGVDGPGPSVADISPVLLNPSRIQHERRKILNPDNKVRDQRFHPKFERFKEKHPDWTVGLHWQENVQVIVLQSPWQRRIGLKDHIKTEAVNGIVSDGCHDYFAGSNQLLFLSSTFEPDHLKSWVPILMTYSNGSTAVHYRIHFLYLFRGLAAECEATRREVTDDLFANFANKLLHQHTLKDLEACARDFSRQFPLAKPWISWWMRPSHLSMLFLVASGMRRKLWNSLPGTTNGGESMHHRFYRMVGRRNQLFYGLEGLVTIGKTFERGYNTARRGHKIYYGHDPQYWKTTAFRYSWTKHGRHESRAKPSTDGRAPDTIMRLEAEVAPKKVKLSKKAKSSAPLPPAEYQRSFRWKNNSCWLDPSLTILFAATVPIFTQMQTIFAALPQGHILLQLLELTAKHTEQAALPGLQDGGCHVLTGMREDFRKKLNQAKFTPVVGSSDAMFGWLNQIFAKLIALKPAPNAAVQRAISFFRAYSVQVKKCSGSELAPREHWELSHPLWRAPFQLSRTMHRIFEGNLSQWFDWLLDPSEWESATCWQQRDSNPFCIGDAQSKEYILSIPAVLIIDLGDSLGSSWTVPASLLPLGKNFSAARKGGIKYNIAGHIYTDSLTSHGSISHFISRYLDSNGTKIFDYDGMRYSGHAKRTPGTKLPGWLAGPSHRLRDVPDGYRLAAIIYNLEGGEEAQQIFYTERQKAAPWGLSLDADTNSTDFARSARLTQPHLEHEQWASKRRRGEAVEYCRTQVSGERSHEDKVTDTTKGRREYIEVKDSDDQTSLDNALLDTIAPVAPAQTRRLSISSFTSSDSTSSATPSPINCYGCGEVSSGDSDQNQWPQAQDDDFIIPSTVHQDKNFCEAILKVLLKPNQIGKIGLAANSTSNPPDHHPLVKIFDAAVTPLARLLLLTIASNWLPEALNDPEAELAPLIRPPAATLMDVEMVSLPHEERRRRVLHVGRAMMHLLAIQHELEEPFNLNGDLFEDIVEQDILQFGLEHEECGCAMFLATNPKQLAHKKHWD
ncbi:hypothetical protein K438DRAFT_2023131 [Mycena galopus ATCC 62051]|nr:hypothetical protein K438DRAFT_2023131 [Mycena galopus ATCC 62051]